MALERELSCARNMVLHGAKVALWYQQQGARVLAVRNKPMGGGPITEADRDLNARLSQALSRQFPTDAVVTEEDAEPKGWQTHGRCWFVDPIDGTRAFARGHRDWVIQVGLAIDGRMRLGVQAHPAEDRISWAVLPDDGPAEHGTQVGRGVATPLRPATAPTDGLRLAGGRLYPFSRQHRVCELLDVPLTRFLALGSVGLRMSQLAHGHAHVYVQAPGRTKVWDTAAPSVLVEAAGGRVTDVHGKPLDYRAGVALQHGVVCSMGVSHEEVIERIAPAISRWHAR